MSNTSHPLKVECPKCGHDRGRLVAESLTVITVACGSCDHTWATDLSHLPPEVQERVHAAVREQ